MFIFYLPSAGPLAGQLDLLLPALLAWLLFWACFAGAGFMLTGRRRPRRAATGLGRYRRLYSELD